MTVPTTLLEAPTLAADILKGKIKGRILESVLEVFPIGKPVRQIDLQTNLPMLMLQKKKATGYKSATFVIANP